MPEEAPTQPTVMDLPPGYGAFPESMTDEEREDELWARRLANRFGGGAPRVLPPTDMFLPELSFGESMLFRAGRVGRQLWEQTLETPLRYASTFPEAISDALLQSVPSWYGVDGMPDLQRKHLLSQMSNPDSVRKELLDLDEHPILGRIQKLADEVKNENSYLYFTQTYSQNKDNPAFLRYGEALLGGITETVYGLAPYIPGMFHAPLLAFPITADAMAAADDRWKETRSLTAATTSGILEGIRMLLIFGAGGKASQAVWQRLSKEAFAKAAPQTALKEMTAKGMMTRFATTAKRTAVEMAKSISPLAAGALQGVKINGLIYFADESWARMWTVNEMERSWTKAMSEMPRVMKGGAMEVATIAGLGYFHRLGAMRLRSATEWVGVQRGKKAPTDRMHEEYKILHRGNEFVRNTRRARRWLKSLKEGSPEQRAEAAKWLRNVSQQRAQGHAIPIEVQFLEASLKREIGDIGQFVRRVSEEGAETVAPVDSRVGDLSVEVKNPDGTTTRWWEFPNEGEGGTWRNNPDPNMSTQHKEGASFRERFSEKNDGKTPEEMGKREPEKSDISSRERAKDETDVEVLRADNYEATQEQINKAMRFPEEGTREFRINEAARRLKDAEAREEARPDEAPREEAPAEGEAREAREPLKEGQTRSITKKNDEFITNDELDFAEKSPVSAQEMVREKWNEFSEDGKRSVARAPGEYFEKLNRVLRRINIILAPHANYHRRALDELAGRADRGEALSQQEMSELQRYTDREMSRLIETDPHKALQAIKEIDLVMREHELIYKLEMQKETEWREAKTEEMVEEWVREERLLNPFASDRQFVREHGEGVMSAVKERTSEMVGVARRVQLSTLSEIVGGGGQSTTFDVVYKQLFDARMMQEEGTNHFIDEFQAMREASGITDNNVFYDMRRKKTTVRTAEGDLKMTFREKLGLLLNIIDPDTRAELLGGDSFAVQTKSGKKGKERHLTQENIDALLRREGMKFDGELDRMVYDIADFFIQYAHTELAPRVRDYLVRETGVNPITGEAWWTRRRYQRRGSKSQLGAADKGYTIQGIMDLLKREGFQPESAAERDALLEHLGFIKGRRTDASAPILISDGIQSAHNLVLQTNALVHMARPMARIRSIFKSDRVNNVIEGTNLEQFGKQVETYLDVMAREAMGAHPHTTTRGFEKLIRNMQKTLSVGILGFNEFVGIMQASSAFNAINEMPGHYIAMAFMGAPNLGGVAAVGARMSKSTYFRNRFESTVEQIVSPGTDATVPVAGLHPTGPWKFATRDAPWYAVRGVDWFAVSRIWRGSEHWVEADVRRAMRGEEVFDFNTSRNITREMLELGENLNKSGRVVDWMHEGTFKEIERRAIRTVTRTQPTFDTMHLTGFGLIRRTNPYLGTFLMFRGQRDKNLDMLTRALYRARRESQIAGGEMGLEMHRRAMADDVSVSREPIPGSYFGATRIMSRVINSMLLSGIMYSLITEYKRKARGQVDTLYATEDGDEINELMQGFIAEQFGVLVDNFPVLGGPISGLGRKFFGRPAYDPIGNPLMSNANDFFEAVTELGDAIYKSIIEGEGSVGENIEQWDKLLKDLSIPLGPIHGGMSFFERWKDILENYDESGLPPIPEGANPYISYPSSGGTPGDTTAPYIQMEQEAPVPIYR